MTAITIFLILMIIAIMISIFEMLTPGIIVIGVIVIATLILSRIIIAISDKKQEKKWTKEFQQKTELQQAQPTAQLNSPFDERIYEKKKLMTFTEKKFYEAIKKAVPENYILLPQVNLATIIRRVDEHIYQNELYRNIDFAIFNSDYIPLLLIEINDDTHNEFERRERDKKVKEICQCAQLPIIAFWTEYGINEEYIYKTIHKYI